MTPAHNQPTPGAQPAWMQRKECGSLFWLRVMCALSQALGRRLSRLVLFGIAGYFLLFASAARRASADYLARSLQRPATWREQYRHVLAFASTIHDRLYLLRDQYAQFDITLSGADALHQHYAEGQGLLLFGAHLGSFEVLRAMARYRPGLQMSMAMYADNAQQINRTLGAINPGANQEIIALGTLDAMLQVHHRLKEGALVGILADRAAGPDHQYLHLPFLGTPAPFPTGPFRMAVMLKHPVYFMTGLYQGGNRYHVHFERLDQPQDAELGREQAMQTLMTRYVAALERQCRAHPFNWFNFYDFWQEA